MNMKAILFVLLAALSSAEAGDVIWKSTMPAVLRTTQCEIPEKTGDSVVAVVCGRDYFLVKRTVETNGSKSFKWEQRPMGQFDLFLRPGSYAVIDKN